MTFVEGVTPLESPSQRPLGLMQIDDSHCDSPEDSFAIAISPCLTPPPGLTLADLIPPLLTATLLLSGPLHHRLFSISRCQDNSDTCRLGFIISRSRTGSCVSNRFAGHHAAVPERPMAAISGPSTAQMARSFVGSRTFVNACPSSYTPFTPASVWL